MSSSSPSRVSQMAAIVLVVTLVVGLVWYWTTAVRRSARQRWQWPPPALLNTRDSWPSWRCVNRDPWIGRCETVISEADCDALLRVPRDETDWHRSPVVTSQPSVDSHDASRTSSTCYLTEPSVLSSRDPATWAWVQTLRHRLANLVGLPESHMEPLQLVRYHAGQEYRPHYDFFQVQQASGRQCMKRGGNAGQRTATLFVYLSDAPADLSGGTHFPLLGMTQAPAKGAGILFSNLTPNARDETQTDGRVLHAGLPVGQGIKYGCNVWFRWRPFHPHK